MLPTFMDVDAMRREIMQTRTPAEYCNIPKAYAPGTASRVSAAEVVTATRQIWPPSSAGGRMRRPSTVSGQTRPLTQRPMALTSSRKSSSFGFVEKTAETRQPLLTVRSNGRLILKEVDVADNDRKAALKNADTMAYAALQARRDADAANKSAAQTGRRVADSIMVPQSLANLDALMRMASDVGKPRRRKKMPSGLSRINPCNKDEEKERFFADDEYNPQFEYKNSVPRKLMRAFKASDKYLENAIYILKKVVADYGGIKRYEHWRGGKVLTEEEVATSVNEYLLEQGLQGDLELRFVTGTVSSASVSGNKINIRVPVQHREHLLRGTLDHEAGTHYFRSLNDKQQQWMGRKSKRKRLGLKDHIQTEEGLACLNTHLFCKSRLLWHAALRYYGAFMAQCMSFRELYDDLEQYVDCPNMRWECCLRCKRGFEDTEKNGGFSKDQAYLAGAIEILQQRRKIDWTALYAGKLALDDVEKYRSLLKLDAVKLPSFLANPRVYMKFLDHIAKENDIKHVL